MADENKEIKGSSNSHSHELGVTMKGMIGDIAT